MPPKKVPARRRGHNEGSVTFDDERNKHQAAFTDPFGKRIKKRFVEEKDAWDWITLMTAQVIQKKYIPVTKYPLGNYVIDFLEQNVQHAVRPRTYERYLSLMDHLGPLADIPIQSVTAKDITSRYAELLQTLSPSTIVKIHRVLGSCFKFALIKKAIAQNPMDEVKPPLVSRKEIEIFTPDEIEKIETANEGFIYLAPVLVATYTGLRLSEVLGLRWQDFDEKTKVLSVNQTLQRSLSQGAIFQEPKTARSRRRISIPDKIVKIINELPRNHELIFSNSFGGRLMPDALIIGWQTMVKKANVRYRNFHCLRHTHATLLLRAGIPITEVSRRLGHAKTSTTLDIYGHTLPIDDTNVAKKITGIYAPKRGQTRGQNDKKTPSKAVISAKSR